MNVANDVFDTKELLLNIVKFLPVTKIISIRKINNYFNKNFYFEFKCINGLVLFNYEHYIIKNIIENEFGVNLKTLCKWFITVKNCIAVNFVVFEIFLDKENISHTEKSMTLFKIDICEELKEALRGQGEEKWLSMVKFQSQINFIVPVKKNEKCPLKIEKDSTWHKTHKIRFDRIFAALDHYISAVDKSIESNDFEKYCNVGVRFLLSFFLVFWFFGLLEDIT